MQAIGRFEALVLTAAGVAGGIAAAAAWAPSPARPPMIEERSPLVAKLTAEALASRVSEAARTASSFERARAFGEAWQHLTPENADAAVTALSDSLRHIGVCELSAFVAALVEFDPAHAFEVSKAWTSPALRESGFYNAAYGWALSGDALGAERAIRLLPEPRAQQIAYRGVVRGLAETGQLQEGARLLARIPPEGRAISIALLVSWVLHAEGPDAVALWAESVPEDSSETFKLEIMNTALVQIASLDLPHAVRWLESFDAKPGTPPSLSLLLLRWLRSDPDAALRWLGERPPSPNNPLDLLHAIGQWRVGAPNEARAWVRSNQQAIRALGEQRTGRPKISGMGDHA